MALLATVPHAVRHRRGYAPRPATAEPEERERRRSARGTKSGGNSAAPPAPPSSSNRHQLPHPRNHRPQIPNRLPPPAPLPACTLRWASAPAPCWALAWAHSFRWPATWRFTSRLQLTRSSGFSWRARSPIPRSASTPGRSRPFITGSRRWALSSCLKAP